MHRAVMSFSKGRISGVPNGKFVDHINHNGLDNRRANLRIVTHKQNGWNRRKTARKSTSRYKGVCWSKRERMWHVQIKKNGKQITIGYFLDEKAAARAYDAKADELFGQYAALNFPQARKPNRYSAPG